MPQKIKKFGITFFEKKKVIPSAKVFGKRGAGKKTFFQKGFCPAKQISSKVFGKRGAGEKLFSKRFVPCKTALHKSFW